MAHSVLVVVVNVGAVAADDGGGQTQFVVIGVGGRVVSAGDQHDGGLLLDPHDGLFDGRHDGVSTGQGGAIEIEGQGVIAHRLIFLLSG